MLKLLETSGKIYCTTFIREIEYMELCVMTKTIFAKIK
jgi:hypothetical protein